MTLITATIALPVLGAILAALASRLGGNSPRWIALITMASNLAISLALLVQAATGPVVSSQPWMTSFGAAFLLEADGLSAVLVVLTNILGLAAVVAGWDEIRSRVTGFHVWLLLLITGVLLVFLSRDALLFYFGYELMLIPSFFLIGMWGRDQLSGAAMKFFLFTFAGSIFILASFLYVYFAHGTQTGTYTFALAELTQTSLSQREQWWIFLGFLIGFGVKVPLVPLHSWLPDTYGFSPTPVTLLLAGVVSKTGAYGLFRFAFPMAPTGLADWALVVQALAMIGILYGAVVAFGQSDFKRLIAYSSVSHMSFIMLGLFVGNAPAIQGAVLQMVTHGLATGALFVIAGALQRRADTLSLDMFGGLWRAMPVLGGFLLFFAFASLGLPGTGNFIGEVYIVGGVFTENAFLGTLAAIGVLLAAVYSLKLFRSTMHGPESAPSRVMPDVNSGEITVLGSLAALVVVLGFYPSLVTGPLFYPPDRIVPASSSAAVTPSVASPAPAAAQSSTASTPAPLSANPANSPAPQEVR